MKPLLELIAIAIFCAVLVPMWAAIKLMEWICRKA